MSASRHLGRVGGLAVGLGLGAAVLAGAGSAWAAPDATSDRSTPSRPAASQPHRTGTAEPARAPRVRPAAASAARPHRAARTAAVTVSLPPMRVSKGASFTVSPEFMTGFAARYVAGGGNPADRPRFFFGDLAVASLDALADPAVAPDQTRLLLGNLAASGYFGGIWLRDNLRGTPATAAPPTVVTTVPKVDLSASVPKVDLSVSALGLHLFDALSTGLVAASQSGSGWLVRAAAHASVPVLLALYGYNKGYLDVVLDNPPAGVPSMRDTLTCTGFLDCNSSAFPLALATRYDGALDSLAGPPNVKWLEMAAWSTVLQTATGAGRFVWEAIARSGGFSPASYQALVDLSSAYLMVSKAAVLSSMTAYADGDTDLGRTSLRLQAGLWMWSGAYFSGLASGAPTGTLPTIVVS